MSTNYEAIGRCTKLREEIEALKVARQKALGELRRQLAATGSPPVMSSTVITFDANQAHESLKALEEADLELMQAVAEYNEWAPQAEARLIELKAPRES